MVQGLGRGTFQVVGMGAEDTKVSLTPASPTKLYKTGDMQTCPHHAKQQHHGASNRTNTRELLLYTFQAGSSPQQQPLASSPARGSITCLTRPAFHPKDAVPQTAERQAGVLADVG